MKKLEVIDITNWYSLVRADYNPSKILDLQLKYKDDPVVIDLINDLEQALKSEIVLEDAQSDHNSLKAENDELAEEVSDLEDQNSALESDVSELEDSFSELAYTTMALIENIDMKTFDKDDLKRFTDAMIKGTVLIGSYRFTDILNKLEQGNTENADA